MEKHAPGPLTVRGPSLGTGQYDDGGDYGIYDSEGIIVGEAYYKVGVEMFRPAEANARLWAAAPDMKAALEAQERFERHRRGCLTCRRGDRCTDGGAELHRSATELRDAAIARADGVPTDAAD